MSIVCEELFKVHRTPEGDAAALQGLSLRAETGEMLAVLGPSGSGKSTLLRILAGLERPSAGTAFVDGHDMARLSARSRALVRRTSIGVIGQTADTGLSPALSVGEAIGVPLAMRGEFGASARRRIGELLQLVGLPASAANARPATLSGGEQQRAAICVALSHRPSVVLADEPTGELDASAATGVLRILRELAEQGSTVILVTHDPAGAENAHRVVRVRDGRVSAEDHAGRQTVVIGEGGWLHVPERLLDSAGIGRRALIRAEEASIVLEPLLNGGEADGSLNAPAPPSARVEPVSAIEAVEAHAIDFTKAYGSRRVFAGFSAHFHPGVLTALLGRSGSGKSTLLRALAGLELPDAGDIVVAGENLGAYSREELADLRRRHVGIVAQGAAPAGFVTATEHVALPGLQNGQSAALARDNAGRWLEAVGLSHRATQRVGRLSAGEVQRVAIARALAGGRGLMLIDEPTSRLDEANARAISSLLRTVAEAYGVNVIAATHDPVLAAQAHRVIELASA